jgi:hypothetical protein
MEFGENFAKILRFFVFYGFVVPSTGKSVDGTHAPRISNYIFLFVQP